MFQKKSHVTRPNKENVLGAAAGKVNNHYKSDHNDKVGV